MANDFTLRASALPMAFRCPGSVRRGELAINETNDAANLGTAAHEALRSLAETGEVDWTGIPALALRSGVPGDDLRMLAALGAKLWPSVAASFPDALTEVSLEAEIAPGVFLTGHADLLSVTGTVARGGDWKTGRKDGDYAHQMRGYCALILLANPELEEVTFTVLWVRDQEIENYTMTRQGAAAWVRELRAVVVDWDGTYRPGGHCAHCPRSHECEAANALVRRDVAVIADKAIVAKAEAELATMTEAEILSLYEKASLVVRYADRVRDAIKAHVREHGDIVAAGARLTLETEERRGLDTLKAWPTLEAQGFSDEDFARCVEIRISKAEKLIAEKAGRGRGAGAIRDFQAALKAADAIEIKETQKLAVRRA